ncbi:hypothetical protein FF1_005569 [Malus domestica]
MQIDSGVELVAVKKLNYVLHDIEKESFLFAEVKPSWRQRIEIAYGVARGLLYLHEECITQIVQCDIKPENILLDDYYNARISDFGSPILTMNQSQIHIAIRRAKGYVACAHEWFRILRITIKVGVYSFDVVQLEIIYCKRSVDVERNCKESKYNRLGVKLQVNGELCVVVDYEPQAFLEQWKLQKFVMVALWCVQEDQSLRPTMRKVVQMLEEKVELHVQP